MQPRLDVTPMALDGCTRNPEDARGIFLRQPGEVAELHELGLSRVLGLKLGQGLVEGQKVFRRSRGRDVDGVKVLSLYPTAVLLPPFAAGVLYQDATHSLGGRGQEVAAIIPMLDL